MNKRQRKAAGIMPARPSPWLASVMTGVSTSTAAPSEPSTYGELKRIVANTPRGDWPSRVNSSLTRSHALDIFTAALNGHPDDQLIADTVRGPLMMRNVLRECRSRS